MPDAWLQFTGSAAAERNAVASALESAGVATSTRASEREGTVGLLFFDRAPEAQATIEALRTAGARGRIVAIAARANALGGGTALRLLQAGAADVMAWDATPKPGADIAARLERWTKVDALVDSPLVANHLVGVSPAWTTLLRQVVEVAAFTDASVLIQGESGTGKELIARLIHTLDARMPKRELILLDCTTVVPDLAGSEFFGHERGAFTGAVSAREGAFGLADGGTLFLDEAGELSPALQAQLLRVIQERTYKRIGGNTWTRSDFRLVCATNRNLAEAVDQGAFRRDLYHRIATWVVRVPPLRERPADILPLVRWFLRQLRPDGRPLELSQPVSDYLLTRAYPGNVRDLLHVVDQICKRHVGEGPLTIGDIPTDELPRTPVAAADAFDGAVALALAEGLDLREIGRAATEAAIRQALSSERGNLQRAARKLGVTDRALQMRRARRDL
ncbi:MAG: sigma 54-interacting transcriptional regulator [Deltaproteobacteria bacterium]